LSNLLTHVLGQNGSSRSRFALLYTFLIAANLAAWGWAFWTFYERPVMLGTALLAYSLGMRHAVDADHIAAIDNVTRKLMQEGKHPISAGFWFAFGHSLIVFLAVLAIAVTMTGLPLPFHSWFAASNELVATVRTFVSMLFLFVVAGMNMIILGDVWSAFRRVRRDGHHDSETLLNRGGLLTRLLRPLFRLISQDWHMLPLGFLFGLGFDTATEIGLLGISGTQAGQGMSIWLIMVFPALFAAGMALIDTTDGVLMCGAYNWALIKPARKLYYNLIITAVSVAVAVLIGGIEALGLARDQLSLHGKFWESIATLNDNFNALGFAIVAIFILAWITSLIIYRYRRLDCLDPVAQKR
jgi:high-affinity nickel-transport protein